MEIFKKLCTKEEEKEFVLIPIIIDTQEIFIRKRIEKLCQYSRKYSSKNHFYGTNISLPGC